MKKNSRRVLAAILAASVLSMTGCGDAKTQGDAVSSVQSEASVSSETSEEQNTIIQSETPIELTYWYSWGGAVQECNENLVQQFNETVGQEKGIHVTAEYQGTYNETTSKLQAAAVAGTMPDASVVGTTSMGIFLKNNMLVSLNSYVERDIDATDFFQGLLKNTVKDDVWYGVPYLCSTPILYLNTTLLEKAGLDPSGPKTWDELAEYCKTVKEKTGAYGLSTFSYEWFMEAFLLEHGTTMLNEEETATNFDCAETREIMNYFKDLQDKGYLHWATSGDEGSSQVTADFTNQNCAMWFSSTASLTTTLKVAKENNFEVNTCFIPADKSYGVPIGGSSIVMFESVPEEKREAVWEFMKFMTDTRQTAYASQTTGYVPLRASAEQEESLQELYKAYPQFKVAVDQLRDYSTGRSLNPNYVECTTVIMNAMDDIMLNNGDMDSVLSAASEKINKLLNQ